MPHTTPRQRIDPTIEIPRDIACLSYRETEHMLAKVEQDRRAEIDRYWALCQQDPDVAAAQAKVAGWAPIVSDLFHLAGDASTPPKPSTIEELTTATARLVQVEAVRAGLVEAVPDPFSAAFSDVFWEDGLVVALKLVDGEPVLVVRYSGPLFHPGSVPEAALSASRNSFLVCETARDGTGAEYEFLTAYVIGSATSGGWTNRRADLRSRSDLMRDLKAMEALVDRGQLGDTSFDVPPLPTFPSSFDRLIAQLKAHKAASRDEGSITSERYHVPVVPTLSRPVVKPGDIGD